MNGAHYHLIVNHVSLFAVAIGAAALAASMARKSTELRVFAVCLFVLAAIFGYISHETGEMAEDVIKGLGGEIPKSFIHEHEEASHWAFRSSVVVAILAVAMEWTARKKQKWFKALQWIVLILAIQGVTVFLRTAYLGGLIKHTEIR